MATRKKKTDLIESADIAEMTNVPSGGWPQINQGSHLTVKTFENGRTELIWDDRALERDVRLAMSGTPTKVITAEESRNIVAEPARPKRQRKEK